jgi:hypothetical protein
LHITTTPSALIATSALGAHGIYLAAAIPLLVAIVVAGIVWRNARRERGSRALWTSLANPDPAARRDALDALSEDALDYNGPLLCELLRFETDPDVLDALAAAVARSKWEPTTDPSLLELRRWVAGGHTRATTSSQHPPPIEDAEPVVATSAPAVGDPRETVPAEPAVVAASGPEAVPEAGVAATDAPTEQELAELLPKVRALLGEDLERLELVSIDGEVLTRWSSVEERVAREA